MDTVNRLVISVSSSSANAMGLAEAYIGIASQHILQNLSLLSDHQKNLSHQLIN